MKRTGVTAVFLLAVVDAIVFLLAAVAHLGVRIPVGILVISEPRIIDAAVVEGIIALCFVGSAYAIRARKEWAWAATVAAHVVGIAGLLVGIDALAAGLGPTTESNAAYHRTMLAVLLGGLLALWMPAIRSSLGRSARAS